MKNSILTTIVTLICALVLASCGTATDTSSNVTSANTTEPTTAVVTTMPTTQTTTITTTATTTKPTTIATTAKPHTSDIKTSAKTVAHTAATTTKKKVVTTTTKKTEARNYSLNAGLTDTEVLWAQQKAIEITSDCPYRRTFHSDRGWAYQMGAYSSVLKENKIFQSMSRKGNCYDNSVMENFFGILKQEMYYGTTYYSFEELKNAIERYIKYYNEKRIKEKLGWMSPVEYRLNTLAA